MSDEEQDPAASGPQAGAPSHEQEPSRERAPAGDPGPLRLTRSRSDRVVAGVAGGLGRYFGIDPVVFRIGFVVVTLLGGSGVLLYLIGWLVVPSEDEPRSVGRALVGRGSTPTALGVALLVLAAILLAHELRMFGGERLLLSVALIVGGILLLRASPADPPSPAARDRGTAPPPPPSPREGPKDPDDPNDPDDPDDPGAPATPDAGPSHPRAPAPPPPSPPAAPRPRSPGRRREPGVGRFTVALILVAAGFAGLFDATDAVDLAVHDYLAGALILTGLGLVVGGWWGRARGLILLGVALTVLLGATHLLDVPLRGGIGERAHRPLVADELREDYRLLAGEMLLDLGALDVPPGITEVEASVAFGELVVLLPRGATIEIEAAVDVGRLDVLGRVDEGQGNEATRSVSGPPEAGTLRLDLDVAAGRLQVPGPTSSSPSDGVGWTREVARRGGAEVGRAAS